MSRRARLLATVLVLCVAAQSAGPAPAAVTPAARLRTTVGALQRAVLGLPARSPGRSSLARMLQSVELGVRRHKDCATRGSLRALRDRVRALRVKPAQRAAIASAALRLEAILLAGPGTRACGGARRTPGVAPDAKVTISTPEELRMTVALPAATLLAKTGAGKAYEQLQMPGLGIAGAPGTPGVPALGQPFAIPDGADVSVTVSGASGYTLDGVDLYPNQAQAVDSASPSDPKFADKPFTVDSKAYASSAPVPGKPAATNAIGMLRDIAVGRLDVAGAQYMPRSRRLKVYTSVNVDIKFKGGTGMFGDSEVASPYNSSWLSVYGGVLANGQTALGNLTHLLPIKLVCGEQMLIVTSHALRAAADTLATSRNAAGILTNVVETGAGAGFAGTTAGDIRAYVQNEVVRSGCVHPSYLTLMGDINNVPTFAGDSSFATIPSDFDYALAIRGFYLPDLAVGRIPAANLTQANTIVSKVVGYETSPPTDPSFYADATVTSFFQGAGTQDQRGFVRTAEQVRNGLIAEGKTVDRIYTTGAANPQTDDLGNPLPADIKKPGFAWNGTGSTLVSDVNAGRFLVITRDHGCETCVGDPAYDTSTVPSFTNGAKLPVWWLIVCSAGTFDNPALPSLAETLLQSSVGGTSGVLAASRESPTEINNRFLLGLTDAVWPNFLPYAGSSTPIRRMGDALNSGKLYVILDSVNAQDFYTAHGWGSPTNEIRSEQRLYNYFGDPSMELRVAAPPLHINYAGLLSGSIVHVTTGRDAIGGVATLLENGAPIGKAFVNGDGAADIDPDRAIGNGKLELVLDQDGFRPATVLVREAAKPPPPQPDLTATAVSSTAPGNVPGSVSITVKNVGVGDAGPFEATVVGTDCNWTATPTKPQTSKTIRFPGGLAAGAEQTGTLSGVSVGNKLTGTANTATPPIAESDSANDTNNVVSGVGPYC